MGYAVKLQNSGATFDLVPDNKIARFSSYSFMYQDIPTSSSTGISMAVTYIAVKCKDIDYYHNNNNGTAPSCYYIDKDYNITGAASGYNNNLQINKSYLYFTAACAASNTRPNAVWFT